MLQSFAWNPSVETPFSTPEARFYDHQVDDMANRLVAVALGVAALHACRDCDCSLIVGGV
jgi:hypothetical protein